MSGAFDTVADAIAGATWRPWTGATDSPYVEFIEQFEGFAHAEIYSKLQALTPRLTAEVARAWRDSGIGVDELFTNFVSALNTAMTGWEGQSREAAEGASRIYAASGDEFADVLKRVAPRLNEISDVVFKLQSSVQPPSLDPIMGASIYDPAGVIAAVEAANEARNEAVETMNAVYKPTFQPGGVGDGVPAFVAPVDPAPGFGDHELGSSATSGPVQSTSSGTSSGVSPAVSTTTPVEGQSETTTQPVVAETAQQTQSTAQPVLAQQNSADDAATQTAAESDSVRPTTMTSSPNTPHLGSETSRYSADSPAYRSSTPSVSPPGQPIVAQSPVVSGSPAVANPAATQSTSRVASGYGGHGMMPGSAAGRRQDDESEHKIPSYLITEENGRELFGERPKTAPPVLGVWDDRP